MRRWLRGLLRFSSQNLNEGGSAWREGRCWLWFPDIWLRGVWFGGLFASPAVSRVERTFEFSWAHFRRGRNLTDFAFEWYWWPATRWRPASWQIHVGFLGGSWWFGVPDHDSWGRKTGFYLFEDHVAWFHDDMNGRTDVGWHRSWFLLDILFGRAEHSAGARRTSEVLIPMPERAYRGTCYLHVDSWKRPRWFTRRIARATIDMEPGEQVPHPGKGENAWDCGEDAMYGITLPATTVSGAVAGMVESVLRRRERYGGSVMWQPTKVEA